MPENQCRESDLPSEPKKKRGQQKQTRERNASPLEPEQRSFIEQKMKKERLSYQSAADACGIAVMTLRNALNGKNLDEDTKEHIIDKLAVPNVNRVKRDIHQLFNIPVERNAYFTGRDDKMEALCAALKDAKFAAVTQVLSGLGGAGKTATAIEYAYRCLDPAFQDYPRYRAIQFVTRRYGRRLLTDGYVNIANSLDLGTDPKNRHDAVRTVIHWMTQRENAPWLLILDNIDDANLLNAFLPKPPQRHYGHIVITSRASHFRRTNRVEIAAMNEEEGVAFSIIAPDETGYLVLVKNKPLARS